MGRGFGYSCLFPNSGLKKGRLASRAVLGPVFPGVPNFRTARLAWPNGAVPVAIFPARVYVGYIVLESGK